MNNPFDEYIEEEGYRDSIATVDSSGKRIWIYPKKPKGRFYDYRKYVSYVLLLILFGLPFIKMNGKPFVLLNVLETEFILFGVYFAPQDFHLFVIAMLIFMVFIVLFTVIYGRLFCGWVCPQTIFMEMVFRRIEYWIEGDANAQRRLDKAPWTTDKYIKKVGKQLIFILISVFIAHTFLSYIIGVDEVTKIIMDPIEEHWQGFIAMIIFTAMFYGVFSVMREQVCTTICPYGRLQGVLLDENSLAVAYDFERGEPRGKLKRAKKNKQSTSANLQTAPKVSIEPVLGDCVDCNLCVKVCPTGIDIRNGTQLECVNCTACMDACDEVMVKIDKPEGLIRIDSYNGIVNKHHKLWNSRVAAYSLVLVALLGLESFLFMNRSSVETLFLRTPGMLYQDNDDGYISNLYNYQLINKTDLETEVTFECDDVPGILFEYIGQPPKTIKNQVSEGAVFIKIPKEGVKGRKNDLTIRVMVGDELIDEAETTFLGPGK
ncbi:MAG: cytochrome c oxidase accessory protein CcoG [Saprospiraceae bacterium]|nr:cytochrome c oxidase accessory protein CcoG [Saprospiraceae bacterium]